MTRISIFIILLGVLTMGVLPSWGGETGQLRVEVRLAEDHSALPGATVTILNTPYTGMSDDKGNVFFGHVAPGTYTISCELEGFGRVRVKNVIVKPDSLTKATCLVAPAAEEVVQVYGKTLVDPSNPATYHYISRKESKASISPDIFSQAKNVPGVVQNGEILDYVFIRGTPQRATYLSVEGTDSRNAVHYTTGVPVFAKGALEGIEIITGTLAPEYGNVIGGVLNSVISTGEGEGVFYGDISWYGTDTAFFDSTSRERNQGLLQLELGWNPSENVGFKVAFANYAGDAMPWTYEINENFVDFYDLWLITRFQPSEKHRIKLVYERSRGIFRFHSGPTLEGTLMPTIFWQTRPHENDLGLFTWDIMLNESNLLQLKLSYLRTYDGVAPTRDGDTDYLTRDEVLNQAITAGYEFRLWDYWPEITFYESRKVQSRIALTSYLSENHEFKIVGDFTYLSIPQGYYLNATTSWTTALLGCPGGLYCPFPSFLRPEDFALWVDYEGNGWELGLAVQDMWKLSSTFRMMFGARLDYWSYLSNNVQVSPRISFIWSPSSNTSVKIGGGRFVQSAPPAAAFLKEKNTFTVMSSLFPQIAGPELIWTRSYVTNPQTCLVNFLACDFARTDIGPEKSWSVDFEWNQALSKSIGFRISGFYKRFEDMIFNGRGFRLPEGLNLEKTWPDALVNGGKGRSYGFEVSFIKLHGSLTGWIAYSYTVAEGTFPSSDYRGGGILTGSYMPMNFDIRHQIQSVLHYSTPALGGIDFYTSFRWNTGYPYTERYWHLYTCDFVAGIPGVLPPPGARPIGPGGCIYVPARDPETGLQRAGLFNGARMPSFLKWDMKLEKTLVRFGPRGELRFVGIVENILNHKNYGTWTTEENSFREIDADTGQVISEGSLLVERRIQLGFRLMW